MQVNSKAFDKRKIPLWIKRLGKSPNTLCSGRTAPMSVIQKFQVGYKHEESI